jgi:hypothetical protein
VSAVAAAVNADTRAVDDAPPPVVAIEGLAASPHAVSAPSTSEPNASLRNANLRNASASNDFTINFLFNSALEM